MWPAKYSHYWVMWPMQSAMMTCDNAYEVILMFSYQNDCKLNLQEKPACEICQRLLASICFRETIFSRSINRSTVKLPALCIFNFFLQAGLLQGSEVFCLSFHPRSCGAKPPVSMQTKSAASIPL